MLQSACRVIEMLTLLLAYPSYVVIHIMSHLDLGEEVMMEAEAGQKEGPQAHSSDSINKVEGGSLFSENTMVCD